MVPSGTPWRTASSGLVGGRAWTLFKTAATGGGLCFSFESSLPDFAPVAASERRSYEGKELTACGPRAGYAWWGITPAGEPIEFTVVRSSSSPVFQLFAGTAISEIRSFTIRFAHHAPSTIRPRSGQFVATLTRNSAMLSLSADMGTSGHFDCKTHMDADVDVLLGPCQVRATGPLLAKLRNLGAPLVRH